jgi:hypothetical protein
MDVNKTQAAAERLEAKLSSLDLDREERELLVAFLAAGALSVEPTDDVSGFAVDSFIWFRGSPLLPAVQRADEAPKETITFEYGGIQVRYATQMPNG